MVPSATAAQVPHPIARRHLDLDLDLDDHMTLTHHVYISNKPDTSFTHSPQS